MFLRCYVLVLQHIRYWQKIMRFTYARPIAPVNIPDPFSIFFFSLHVDNIPYCAADFFALTQLFYFVFCREHLHLQLARRTRRKCLDFHSLWDSNECIFLCLLLPEADYSLRAHAIRPGIFYGKMKRRQFIADRKLRDQLSEK